MLQQERRVDEFVSRIQGLTSESSAFFRQLIKMTLQMDPLRRPSASEVIGFLEAGHFVAPSSPNTGGGSIRPVAAPATFVVLQASGLLVRSDIDVASGEVVRHPAGSLIRVVDQQKYGAGQLRGQVSAPTGWCTLEDNNGRTGVVQVRDGPVTRFRSWLRTCSAAAELSSDAMGQLPLNSVVVVYETRTVDGFVRARCTGVTAQSQLTTCWITVSDQAGNVCGEWIEEAGSVGGQAATAVSTQQNEAATIVNASMKTENTSIPYPLGVSGTRFPCEFRVVAAETKIRTGPSLETAQVSIIRRGDVVTATEKTMDRQGNVRVRVGTGWATWIAKNGTVMLQEVTSFTGRDPESGSEPNASELEKDQPAQLTGNAAVPAFMQPSDAPLSLRYCAKCGKGIISEKVKFCSGCGAPHQGPAH